MCNTENIGNKTNNKYKTLLLDGFISQLGQRAIPCITEPNLEVLSFNYLFYSFLASFRTLESIDRFKTTTLETYLYFHIYLNKSDIPNDLFFYAWN